MIKITNIGLMVMLVNRAFDSDNGNIYKEYAVQTPEGMLYDVTPCDMSTFLGMYYSHLGREQSFFNKPISWYEGQVMTDSEQDSLA